MTEQNKSSFYGKCYGCGNKEEIFQDYARVELNLRKEDILKPIAKQQQGTRTDLLPNSTKSLEPYTHMQKIKVHGMFFYILFCNKHWNEFVDKYHGAIDNLDKIGGRVLNA